TLERYPNVWQMTSTVRARTSAPLADVMAAAFPSASVTGAPKHRTMEIIASLETSPRGIYTGAIGHVAPDGTASFNVAIRTAVGADRTRRIRLLLDRAGRVRTEHAPLESSDRVERVRLAAAAVDPADPFLFHKTTNRAVYEAARRPDCDDVILWNGRGEVTES